MLDLSLFMTTFVATKQQKTEKYVIGFFSYLQ